MDNSVFNLILHLNFKKIGSNSSGRFANQSGEQHYSEKGHAWYCFSCMCMDNHGCPWLLNNCLFTYVKNIKGNLNIENLFIEWISQK